MKKNAKILGVSGHATVGKDTFCYIFKDLYESKYKIRKIGFADALKEDLYTLITNRFGLDIFNISPELKKAIRPLLVGYGEAQRNCSKGKYWIKKVEDLIDADNETDIFLISDVRFAEYEDDEIWWLKNKMGGKLVYIDRWIPYGQFMRGLRMVEPANDKEAANNPVLKENADYKMGWHHVECENIYKNPYMIDTVKTAVEALNYIT